MSTAVRAIRSLLNAVSGPAILRAQLRARTRSVRTAAQPLRTVHSLRTSLPSELVGGELLSLLSDRLRRLIELQTTGLATLTNLHPDAFQTHNSDGTGMAEPVTPLRLRQLHTHPTNTSPLSRSAEPESPRGRNLVADEPLLPRRPESNDNLFEFESRSSAAMANPLNVASAQLFNGTNAADVPIILRLIRQYWTGAQPRRKHSDGERSGPSQSHHASNGITESEAPQVKPMPQEQISDRMKAFVSGTLAITNPSPVTAEREWITVLNDKEETRFTPSPVAAPRWSSSANDLAERLADVLREQAMYHGIDIS